MPACRCADLEELEGKEALDYAIAHLRKTTADPSGWVTMYHCPKTGLYFVMDYPHSGVHGGGLPKLRRVV